MTHSADTERSREATLKSIEFVMSILNGVISQPLLVHLEGIREFVRNLESHAPNPSSGPGGTGRLGSDPASIGGGSGVRFPGVADPSLPDQTDKSPS